MLILLSSLFSLGTRVVFYIVTNSCSIQSTTGVYGYKAIPYRFIHIIIICIRKCYHAVNGSVNYQLGDISINI